MPEAVGASVDLALRAWVESRRDELVAFLRALVRERSVLGEEEGAQRLVEERLRRLGLDVRRVQPRAGSGEDSSAAVPLLPYDGRTCVVGTLAGGGGGRDLHLSGHVDVVPVEAADLWTHDPWGGEVVDGRMYGRGAGDMKAGVAAYLFALQALLEVAGPPAGDVVFSSVIDEECGGNGMKAVLDDAGLHATATLIGEPTDLAIDHGGVGVVWARLTARSGGGHAADASALPSPVDQLLAAAQALRALERTLNAGLPGHPYNLNIGELHAGAWPSSVPDRGTMRVRLGFGPDRSPREAQARMRAAVAAAAPEVQVEFEGFQARAYRHEPAGELADALIAAHRQLRGEAPRFEVSTATTDARFVEGEAYCLGPRCGAMHGIDEWVDLETTVQTAAAIAIVAHAWCKAGAA